MVVRAGPHEHCTPGGVPGAGKFNTSMAYWACGTPGLHFSLVPGGACFWAPSERGQGLEMFINSGHSASPTMSPTSSPSNCQSKPHPQPHSAPRHPASPLS